MLSHIYRRAAVLICAALFASGCSSTPAPQPTPRPVEAPPTPLGVSLIADVATHAGAIHAVAVSPDGQLAASGGVDKKIVLTRLSNRAKVREIAQPDEVSALAFDLKGAVVVSVNGNTLYRWSVADGSQLFKLPLGESKPDLVILADDGSSVATLANLELKVWDAASGRLLKSNKFHQRAGRKMLAGVFAADGSYLVLAGQQDVDGKPNVRTWTVPLSIGGRNKRPLFGNDGTAIVGLDNTSDDKVWVIVTADDRPMWHVYSHIRGGGPPREIDTPSHGRLKQVALGPAGSRFVLVDDVCRLYDVPPRLAEGRSPGPALQVEGTIVARNVENVAFTPDRGAVLIGTSDGKVRLYAIGVPSSGSPAASETRGVMMPSPSTGASPSSRP